MKCFKNIFFSPSKIFSDWYKSMTITVIILPFISVSYHDVTATLIFLYRFIMLYNIIKILCIIKATANCLLWYQQLHGSVWQHRRTWLVQLLAFHYNSPVTVPLACQSLASCSLAFRVNQRIRPVYTGRHKSAWGGSYVRQQHTVGWALYLLLSRQCFATICVLCNNIFWLLLINCCLHL